MSTTDAPPDPVSRAIRLAERFRVLAGHLRADSIEMGQILVELVDLDQWHAVGCGSPGHLGERCALSSRETRVLLDLGRAVAAEPALEEDVRIGQAGVEGVAALGEALSTPALQRPGDDWLGWVRTESTQVIRARVQQRKEEARLGDERAHPLTVYIGQQARDDFGKARTIASRKAGHILTPGQTFGVVTKHYLASFDDERVTPPRRRAPPATSGRSRYIPRAVCHEVNQRQHGRCAVPFCGNTIFVDMAHLVPHAGGGSREADNLLLLCSTHHKDLDSGWLTVQGAAANPRFFDRSGHDMAVRFGQGPVGPVKNDPPPEPAGDKGGTDPP